MHIYTGFILPVKRLTHFQDRAYTRVVSVLARDLEKELAPLASLPKTERGPKYWEIEKCAKELYTCGYYFFLAGRFAYAYMWGNTLFTYTGNDLDYVRQYPYWHDTPKPAFTTNKHWAARGKQWEKLHEQTAWNQRLSWQALDNVTVHNTVMSLVRGESTNVEK